MLRRRDHPHKTGCGCKGGGGWSANLQRIRMAIAGPDPIAAGYTGAVDAAYSNGMAGRTGTIMLVDSADPVAGFRGYLAYQKFPAITPGASATLLRSPPIALPSTSGEVSTLGASTSVLEHLARVQTAAAQARAS